MNADERLAKLDADHAAGYLSNSQYMRLRGLIEENPDFCPGVGSTKASRKAAAMRRKAKQQPGNKHLDEPTPHYPTGPERRGMSRRQRRKLPKDPNRKIFVPPSPGSTAHRRGGGFDLPVIRSTKRGPNLQP